MITNNVAGHVLFTQRSENGDYSFEPIKTFNAPSDDAYHCSSLLLDDGCLKVVLLVLEGKQLQSLWMQEQKGPLAPAVRALHVRS